MRWIVKAETRRTLSDVVLLAGGLAFFVDGVAIERTTALLAYVLNFEAENSVAFPYVHLTAADFYLYDATILLYVTLVCCCARHILAYRLSRPLRGYRLHLAAALFTCALICLPLVPLVGLFGVYMAITTAAVGFLITANKLVKIR